MTRSEDGSAAGSDSNETNASELTGAVGDSRRGFRRDVANLIAKLQTARLFVPLAHPIAGVPAGVEVELTSDLSLSPHLIADEEGVGYAVLFTEPELLEHAAEYMGFQTGAGALEYVALPAALALSVALELTDGERASGLLINPLSQTELMLRRDELASIAQGKAIPLVGYVSEIPYQPGEPFLIAEMEGPPPSEVMEAIEGVLASFSPRPRYVLRQTFNAERDLEPHLTLNLLTDDVTQDLVPAAERLAEVLEGKLPPPGYIDILFNDEKLQ